MGANGVAGGTGAPYGGHPGVATAPGGGGGGGSSLSITVPSDVGTGSDYTIKIQTPDIKRLRRQRRAVQHRKLMDTSCLSGNSHILFVKN